MWARMTEMADELIGDHGLPAAIGVSVAGPVDASRGIVQSPPNLPGWDAIPLKDLLVDRFNIPTYVEHDAKAGALAEWLFGAGRGFRDVIFLTLGTGLGCGLILDGQLYRGRNDHAGEVGHWRMAARGPEAYGKAGSWEAFSSGAGLPRLARHLFPGRQWPEPLTAETLVLLAREREPSAARVVQMSATWLGRGIALLVDLLDPEVVVLGSLAVRAGDLFLPVVRAVVQKETVGNGTTCQIVASELGEAIGDVAALSAAIYHGQLGPPARRATG